MKKETIAIDVDKVLAKLDKKWLNYYNTIFDDNLQEEQIKSWDITEFVKPEAKPYMLNILNLHKFYRDLEVVEDSQRVLYNLSKEYEIVFATDPFTRMSFKSKYDWLGENFPFIPKENYIFTGNKSKILADYLIDDAVHNLEVFQGISLLFDASYNKEEERFFRVLNWQDIENVFELKLDKVKEFYQKAS